ncbi:MAG: LPS export ABC transporter permease LptF [Deltaproteobacteria bacterium]|nr:LPS export ABC transporter permease LptF [Deltaproteobacteria bacterium]MBI5810905.1 LPS export ABC transporter permease LptF [Deltaproteobacteria bacterium]
MDSMPRIIYSYIFREMSGPFLLSLGILTFTMLLSKILKLVELVVNYGVGLLFVAKFIVFLLPSILIYIIPVSVLVAVLVAFGRLSADNEIIAMKASGIGLNKLLRPVMFAGTIFFGAALFLTLYGFPWGNLSIRRLLYEAARTKANIGIKEKTFNSAFKGLMLYAGGVSPGDGSLDRVFIYDQREGKDAFVITAKRGRFLTDPEGFRMTLRLYDGAMHSSDRNGVYRIATFENYDLNPQLPDDDSVDPAVVKRHNRELYFTELIELYGSAKAADKDPAPYMMEAQKRLALPASVLVFCLIGIPLGIQKVRNPRLTGFSGAIAVVAFYFILTLAMDALGGRRVLSPITAAWAPFAITGAFGVYAFLKESKDRPFKPVVYMEEGISFVAGFIRGIFSAQGPR